jgi:5'-nucleotidase
MTSRRDFIKQVGVASLMLAVPSVVLSGKKKKNTRVVILHTSDVHSHIEPLAATDARYANRGGFARRAELIGRTRLENEHVLLLDSGDVVQGTPYFNLYGGTPEMELMARMGYDAATLGNHEFDKGMDHLAGLIKQTSFPFINCNYDVSGTPLEGLLVPYKIFEKGNARIGVVGLGIDLSGLVSPTCHAGLKYLNPIEKGEETARYLKKEKDCDIVIALSHLGLESDKAKEDDLKVATGTRSIDLILGGHTHTFMKEPLFVKNAAGKEVMIVHSGEFGVQISRIELVIGGESKASMSGIKV